MRARFPDGRAMTDIAASFIAPNSRLTPFERLEIYNQQYWFRVKDALAEDFNALRRILGSPLPSRYSRSRTFRTTLSRSFSMRNLGSKLVDWLVAHPEALAGRRHRIWLLM